MPLDQTHQVHDLILHLRGPDISACLEAAKLLAQIRAHEALPALVAALNYGDQVYPTVIDALCSYHSEAVETLVNALSLPMVQIQIGAARALCRLKSRESIPALIVALAHAKPELSKVILEEVLPGLCARPNAAICDALEHPDQTVRVAAACLLGRQKTITATPYLIRALNHSDLITRESAVQALIQLGVAAIPDLIKNLKEASPACCSEIARVFLEIGEMGSVALQVVMMQEKDAHIRSRVQAILNSRPMA